MIKNKAKELKINQMIGTYKYLVKNSIARVRDVVWHQKTVNVVTIYCIQTLPEVIEMPRWNCQWYRVCKYSLPFFICLILKVPGLRTKASLWNHAKFKVFLLVYNNTSISFSSPNTTVIALSSWLECHKVAADEKQMQTNTSWESCRNGKRIRTEPPELQTTSSQPTVL